MAGLSISSISKRCIVAHNKTFQQSSLNHRAQPWVSRIPHPTRPVRAMSLIYENVQSAAPRRTANYHSDVWSDDVLQSLNTPYHQNSPYQQWADNLVAKVKEIFKALEDGEISASAYDTAWVAMIPAQDGSHSPHFPQAIKWLLNNQMEDGSWGFPSTFLLSDRLLSTLASVVALRTWNAGQPNVEKGVRFIQGHLQSLEKEESLSPDFEIIFPAFVRKAESLGLSLSSNTSLTKRRAMLLNDISTERDISTQMLNALEGLEEVIDWKKIMKFQSNDGSFLSSPASTACVLINTGDKGCLSFLNNLMNKFSWCVPCLYPIDLLERLSLVDNIERLGIGRHFKQEIKEALDYVYGYWSEKGIGCGRDSLFADLNTTALGLRTLRNHGYNVSTEVLNNFKDENGCFFSSCSQRNVEHRSMLNLFRASDLALPGETIMDKARVFSYNYLRESLKRNYSKLWNEKIAKETEDALEFSWHLSISILEARDYIEAYDDNQAQLGKTLFNMPYIHNACCKELAKLNFSIEQSLHQAELKLVSSWWKKSRMIEVDFARQRIVETYFSVGTFEPEFSQSRINFTKIGSLVLVMDDIYDTYGTVEELITFTQAINRFDISLVDKLPNYMKIIFKAWYQVVNETNEEATKQQGRDMLHYIRKDWEMFVDSLMKEREWSEDGYIPTMEEYLETRCISVGLVPCALHPIFLMSELVTDNDLPIIHESSNLFQLVALIWRLKNDTATAEAEEARGQINSCIACYIKQNPNSTREDALQYFEEVLDRTLKQLNYEYFNLVVDAPKCGKKFVFNLRQCCMLLYKDKDGYGSSSKETKEYIRKTLIEPLHLW